VPELPEVETVRRGLARQVVGRTITGVDVLHPRAIRRHLPGAADFTAALIGRRIVDVRRRGSTCGCRSIQATRSSPIWA